MFELIEKLRAKPEKAKSKIALLAAFLVTGIIFVFWIGVIFPNWKSSQSSQSEGKVAKKSEPSPLDSLNAIFSKGVKSIGEQINQIRNEATTYSAVLESTSSASTATNNTPNPQN